MDIVNKINQALRSSNELNDWLSTQYQPKKQKSKSKQSSASAKASAQEWAEIMRDILRDEIKDIRSSTTGQSFLDYVEITSVREGANGHVFVGVKFDESEVTRSSLVPKMYRPVYMPALINNGGYKAKNQVWGVDRHGQHIGSSVTWKNPEDHGFMQRAVDRFNAAYKHLGVTATLSDIYK